jgi:hypothetical protein
MMGQDTYGSIKETANFAIALVNVLSWKAVTPNL